MALLLNIPTIATVVGAFVLLTIIKRRYFTAGIRDIPGPLVGSFSVLWQLYHIIHGHIEEETIKLHRTHGKLYAQQLGGHD